MRDGLQRGDRVALLIENSVSYVVTYYAILKAVGITVALNTEGTSDDLAFFARDCAVRILVIGNRQLTKLATSSSRQDVADKLSTESPVKKLLVWSDMPITDIESQRIALIPLPSALEGESSAIPDIRLIDLVPASIVYTLGSTGKPRGAVLSHLNIVTNTRSIVDYLELTPADRIMVVLPFYYIYGKSILNTHFFVGGSVVIDNRFLYPNVILQTMKDQRVTGFAGVPSTFTILLNQSTIRSTKFKDLRYVTQAGGAMHPTIQKEVSEAFAPAKLFIMYGATEASARLSYLHADDLPRKWGSINKAIPNVDLIVADAQGRVLPPGVEGEILARGANIMSVYWNDPAETERVLNNGFYHTGDIGRTDAEGFIYVVGRTKDMIKIGGNRVSAKEIEEALCEHPAIVESAVIGVPNDVLGEAPKAFIVIQRDYKGAVQEELPAFLQKRLAAYKIPKRFEIRDSLPKSESGKILKLKLS